MFCLPLLYYSSVLFRLVRLSFVVCMLGVLVAKLTLQRYREHHSLKFCSAVFNELRVRTLLDRKHNWGNALLFESLVYEQQLLKDRTEYSRRCFCMTYSALFQYDTSGTWAITLI